MRAKTYKNGHMYLYFTYDTEIGDLMLVSDGKSIVTVHYGAGALRPDVGIEEEDPILMDAYSEINQYFFGQRREFTIPCEPMGSEEEIKILNHLKANVPYGKFISYEALAEDLGIDIEAVRKAVDTCTCPIFYPTHSVINADKTPGGYVAEVNKKVRLLKLEVMNVRNR